MALPDGVIELLNQHRKHFVEVEPLATRTGHTVPSDTKSWSQILVSLLTGTPGLARKKGADLADGSDVKAANYWKAIDRPRFNGVVKAGRKGQASESVDQLDGVPYLYFVLWDNAGVSGPERCRVWAARANSDKCFRGMCEAWLKQAGRSSNFQLHPPLNVESNTFRNECGDLQFPLLFRADWDEKRKSYVSVVHNPGVLKTGQCCPDPESKRKAKLKA